MTKPVYKTVGLRVKQGGYVFDVRLHGWYTYRGPIEWLHGRTGEVIAFEDAEDGTTNIGITLGGIVARVRPESLRPYEDKEKDRY